ncbi:MAG TPA: ATP-binding cassette domain-containing protein [Kiritimatiellia bacterium]|nr:ATP-binding cassette domain-containing protein [Kiritimatiellia bacterium]
MTSSPLLEVRDLTRDFVVRGGLGRVAKRFRAVDGVSFDLHRGDVLGIVGESGSGKSTLVRMITRLIAPTRGEVRLDGHDLLALSGSTLRAERRRFQMIFQDPYASLNPRWNMRRILDEPLRAHGLKSDGAARIASVLDQVGLPTTFLNRYPHELSGGQRQRLNIARALIPGPDLLVADEPVAALDVSIQAQTLNLLLDLQRDRGLTLLFIAHDLAVIKTLCNRVGVMSRGKLVDLGEAEDVFKNPTSDYTRTLLDAIPRMPARADE